MVLKLNVVDSPPSFSTKSSSQLQYTDSEEASKYTADVGGGPEEGQAERELVLSVKVCVKELVLLHRVKHVRRSHRRDTG